MNAMELVLLPGTADTSKLEDLRKESKRRMEDYCRIEVRAMAATSARSKRQRKPR